ncbi:MAG: hypothetical protein MZV64_02235 [Ignavibacteriales bacterium]|nr:hypothetical protein [Ignavibacteriales bacterium]
MLRWVVVEMEHRYRLLEAAHARDLEAYNRKLARKADGNALPRIVVLIDELADLMMSAPDADRAQPCPPGADGARHGHSSDRRHPASLHRCGDRT